jgi:hypothetical protein
MVNPMFHVEHCGLRIVDFAMFHVEHCGLWISDFGMFHVEHSKRAFCHSVGNFCTALSCGRTKRHKSFLRNDKVDARSGAKVSYGMTRRTHEAAA